ncbi:DMT family transporter [Salinispira pacifica]
MLLNLLLLLAGQVVAATAVIAIKMSTMHPVLLAGVRLFIAAAALTPLYLRDSRRQGRSWSEMAAAARLSLLPGLFLALHFVTWNYGARTTIAANANLIVNLVPVVMPFIIYATTREMISLREVAGTIVALLGVAVLTGGDVELARSTFAGDLICLVSMVFLSLYMGLARSHNRQPTVWLYVVPLYWVASAISFIATAVVMIAVPSAPAAQTLVGGLSASNLALAAYLGLLPTVIGHTIINRSMRVLPSQVVSLSMLTQFIFAGLLAYVLFGEMPTPLLLPAAILIVAGASLVVFSRRRAAALR